MQYLDETRIGFLFDPFLKYLGAIFISLFVLLCRKFLLSCLDVVEHWNFNKIYNYFTVISYFLCLSSNWFKQINLMCYTRRKVIGWICSSLHETKIGFLFWSFLQVLGSNLYHCLCYFVGNLIIMLGCWGTSRMFIIVSQLYPFFFVLALLLLIITSAQFGGKMIPGVIYVIL